MPSQGINLSSLNFENKPNVVLGTVIGMKISSVLVFAVIIKLELKHRQNKEDLEEVFHNFFAGNRTDCKETKPHVC